MTLSRSGWFMSPCIATAANPRPSSFSASSADAVLRAPEDQHGLGWLELQDLRQHFELLPLGDVEEALLDRRAR